MRLSLHSRALSKILGFDPDKMNVNGSGISLGYPVCANGAILSVNALYELVRTRGRVSPITMCVGGGQGIAMVVDGCTNVPNAE